MGKIRIATLGSEEEQKQKEKAEKRRAEKEAVKAKEKSEETKETSPVETTKKKQYKKTASRKRSDSKRHKQNVAIVNKTKAYPLPEALDMLGKMKPIQFDETVELHINTFDKGLSGSVILPHGTGKQTRVVIVSPAKDPKAADEVIAQIQGGKITFDVLIATPEAMPKLARVAKILGPRGLMPNPKSGTVTTKPEEAAKQYEGGQMNFKTEAKLPLLHLSVGKISFGKEKLEENIKKALDAVQAKNIRNATLKSTMSAAIKIKVA